MEFVLEKIRPMFGFIKKNYLYFLLLVLMLPSVWDLLKPGFFPMHDDLQVFRLHQVDKCFKDFQFPCRWVPDAGFGYGYPLMQFYPPMPYYPMQILNMAGFGLFWSVKIMFALSFLVSGFGMLLLAKHFFGPLAGLLSAVLYVYSPYHSVDVYVRGAMNEAWGMAWFPFVLYYIYQIITDSKKKSNFVYLSVLLALQLTSHNVMTMVFAPTAILWAIFWLISTKKFQSIYSLIFSGLLGIGLSAFFFIPVVLEQKFVHVDSMIVGYFNYLAHFADIKQLFLTNFWGYGGSTWGPEDGMSFSVGHFQWILSLIASFFALLSFKKYRQISLLVLFSTAFAFGYAFLTHSKSSFFWENLSLLQFSQFPWRLVALSVFYFSFAAGFSAMALQNHKLFKVLVTSLVLAIIFYNATYFRVDRPLRVTQAEKLSGLSWENQVTGGIFDYLPRSAQKPPGSPAPSYPWFTTGNGGIADYQKGTNWIKFNVQITQDSSTLVIPIYDYQGLRVKVNSKLVTHTTQTELGLVTISLPQGQHLVDVKVANTPLRNITDIVSLVSVFILFYLIKKNGRRK